MALRFRHVFRFTHVLKLEKTVDSFDNHDKEEENSHEENIKNGTANALYSDKERQLWLRKHANITYIYLAWYIYIENKHDENAYKTHKHRQK